MSDITTLHGCNAVHTRSRIVALHCSGASGRQWQQLRQVLGSQFNLLAPDLIGCGARPHWSGDHSFTLADEAAPIVSIMDALDMPVHLVGHSYGGGVALRAAVERPDRVASLSLYEPTAFHVLNFLGAKGRVALNEIRAVAAQVGHGLISGAYQSATRDFVDYWSGTGTFDGLKPEMRANLVRFIPKASLDFRALISEPIPLEAYRQVQAPLLLLCGEHAPEPAALVARKLAEVMNPGALRIVDGAGHMGPFSHAEIVMREISNHILAAELAIHRCSNGRSAIDVTENAVAEEAGIRDALRGFPGHDRARRAELAWRV
jgi:pimeloyl-ACP methyl ester carboxylesterase